MGAASQLRRRPRAPSKPPRVWAFSRSKSGLGFFGPNRDLDPLFDWPQVPKGTKGPSNYPQKGDNAHVGATPHVYWWFEGSVLLQSVGLGNHVFGNRIVRGSLRVQAEKNRFPLGLISNTNRV